MSTAAELSVPLISGAFAGLAVDLTLFPLDTIKTRLQASGGLLKNGGYRGLYRGMGSIAAGSAPGAALFFLSYEASKSHLPISNPSLLAVSSGSIAETLACLIRVPTEVIKQRTQTASAASSWQTLSTVLRQGGVSGVYRGFAGTLAREIPFVAIQFPLWEALKRQIVKSRSIASPDQATPSEAAVCGALAGAISAAATTPMDVIKTRLMLSNSQQGYLTTLRAVVQAEGVMALTKGMIPRVCWIGAGGFIFLGGYSLASDILHGVNRA